MNWPRASASSHVALPGGGTDTAKVAGLVLVSAVAIGGAVALDVRLAATLTALVIALAVIVAAGSRLVDMALGTIAVLLIGYAFLGRGFAYFGVPPLFIGELGLVLGLVALLVGPRHGPVQPTQIALAAFAMWGALQTFPYLPTYGVDALRDGVAWAYGLFAIVVSVLLTPRHLMAGLRIYQRAIPFFLVWVPIAIVLTETRILPTAPGSDVSLVHVKGGDIGVQLAAIAAFILVGLYARGRPPIPEVVTWALWLFAVALVGILNRGGLLAASAAGAALLYVRAASRVLTVLYVAVALLTVVIIVDPKIETAGRAISMSQMVDNLTSLVSDSNEQDLEGTKAFRLRWWGEIVDYTVGGPYFWTGKGFGINLADADGFQPTEDRSLRAPHNGHIEILARAGVPGLALWLLLQLVYAASLMRAAARARARDDALAIQALGFVFVFWFAALINSTFDPYLQGPQGGVWYWTMMGVGIAVVRMADAGQLARASQAPTPS